MLPQLLALIVQYYPLICALVALGFVWYAVQFVRGQRRLGVAQFQLERDRASSERGSAVLWLLLLLAVLAGSSYVNFALADTIDPSLLIRPEPTPVDLSAFNVTSTVTPTRPPRAELPTATAVVAPTATLRNAGSFSVEFPDDAATPIPTLEVEGTVVGCNGDAIIREPASGRTISGGTSIFGRAMGSDFAFYRFDILGPATGDAWEPLLPDSFNQPVREGFLASVALADWDTGVYQIRLSVFATNNTLSDSCVIQVGIVN